MRSALAAPLPFWWRTGTELEHLRAEGCDKGQGYLFAKARPQADILFSQAERRKQQLRKGPASVTA
jgi:hypothetical protein